LHDVFERDHKIPTRIIESVGLQISDKHDIARFLLLIQQHVHEKRAQVDAWLHLYNSILRPKDTSRRFTDNEIEEIQRTAAVLSWEKHEGVSRNGGKVKRSKTVDNES
jgi:hypothetical protein